MGHRSGPHRSAHPLVAWAALLAGGAALLVALGAPGLGATERTDGPRSERHPRGDQHYARTCAVCHGSDGRGQQGDGIAAGPPLVGLDVAYVDLLLRSGRMPIAAPEEGMPHPERLDADEREAVVAFMTERFHLRGGIPSVREGDPARGRELYAIHCAACHGSTGTGGVSGDGTLVRAVLGLDEVAIAEAIRTGPFEMPRFGPTVLSDRDVDDVATYVAGHMSTADRTPLGLGEMNRVTMWGMAAVLGAAVLGMTVLIARPLRGPATGEEGQP